MMSIATTCRETALLLSTPFWEFPVALEAMRRLRMAKAFYSLLGVSIYVAFGDRIIVKDNLVSFLLPFGSFQFC